MNKTNLPTWLGLLITLAAGLAVLAIFVWLGSLGGPRYYANPGKRTHVTIHNIQGCIDHWRPECADLDFTPLNGVYKSYLIDKLPASASVQPPVVCEQDAPAEQCTSVHWANH